jgi:ADP-ribose pyrophosphatase
MKNVYKGKLLNVWTFSKKLPTGVTAELEMIKHPGAALIVPFLTMNKIILLKQYRAVLGKYIYEVPAGSISNADHGGQL